MKVRRSVAALVVTIGLVLGSAGTAQAATYPLVIGSYGSWTYYSQQETLWCWAAAAKMVIYHRSGSNSPTQCAIVKYGKDTTGCANVTGTFLDLQQSISHYGYNTSIGATRPSYSVIDNAESGGLGIFARVIWDSGSSVGHIAPLISAYVNSSGTQVVRIVHIRTTNVTSSWVTYSQFSNGTAGLGAGYSPSGGYLKG